MIDPASKIVVASVEGYSLSPQEKEFFTREQPAGVTLFARNIPQDNFSIVRNLAIDLQKTRAAGTPPLIIAVDQEGGRVSRIPSPFPNLGPAISWFEGRSDAEALTLIEEFGKKVGTELRSLGFNINFVPVLDILGEKTSPAIGSRCFGKTPETVSKRGGAFFRGIESAGIVGCLKHFPGQGAAEEDTHFGAATVVAERETLEKRELAAFRPLLDEAQMVMISHCKYSALSEEPGTTSREIVSELLKEELHFKGLAVSDDMMMKALAQDDAGWQDQLLEAIRIGIDLLLVCKGLDRANLALAALRREAARSRAFALRLADAADQVWEFRKKLFDVTAR